ncbi:MAG: TonB-dependent receptor [Chloroherpetonaceae bacterium]
MMKAIQTWSTQKAMLTVLVMVAWLMQTISSPLLAGTTGKIAGTVTDANTGEPLIGATVIVVGTKLGAKTDFDGNYVILNVPPGVYEVRATYVGYQPKLVKNIKVSVDLTSRADFKMGAEEIQSAEVVVTAERPLVIKDMTATRAAVGSEEIRALPIQNPSQVLEIQGGVIGGTVRGGRRGEVAYIVDGFAVNDVYDGNRSRGVNNIGVESQAIQELELLTGGYNAEYGQAMAGIVNIVTKDGGSKYEGSLQTFFGDYVSGRSSLFPNINSISPIASRDIQGSFSGPMPGMRETMSFFINARYFEDEGRFYGQNVYRPGDVLPASEYTGNQFGGFLTTAPSLEAFLNSPDFENFYQRELARDATLSRENYRQKLFAYPVDPNTGLLLQNSTRIYQALRTDDDFGRFAFGDRSFVPMNAYRKFSGMGKLTYRPVGTFKISGQFLYSDEEFQNFNFSASYIPYSQPKNFRNSYTAILNATHTLSSSTFYTFGVSLLRAREASYLYEDLLDPRYIASGFNGPIPGGFFSPGQAQNGFEFLVAGKSTNFFERSTRTLNVKGDITSQIDKNNLIKTGFDVKFHRLQFENQALLTDERALSAAVPFFTDESGNVRPGIRRAQLAEEGYEYYDRRPIEFAAYVQDKFEINNFIVNIGLRLDLFEPDGIVPKDPSDPSLYNPIKDQNRPRDANGNFIEFRPGDPDVLRAYRENGERLLRENYRKASVKWQLSPRLGMAFPVTEQGILRLFYGQVFQIPNFEFLYRNPYFRQSAAGVSGPFGNADLKPQKTIKGELGLQQQFGNDISVDVALYFNDIRNLNGTAFIQQFFDGRAYTKFVNTDYALVRGLTISVNKRFTSGFNFGVDYTFQVAQGNASDPQAAAFAIQANPENPILPTRLIPLDWDQRHTLNITAAYTIEGWEISSIMRYGSGFPYTPDLNAPFPILTRGSRGEIVTNSRLLPATFTVDMRAQKIFKIDKYDVGFFVQIYNLFDAGNQSGLFPFAQLTPDLVLRNTFVASSVNSPSDFLRQPQNFAPPRQILSGVSLYF